jgi:hypothetical protein
MRSQFGETHLKKLPLQIEFLQRQFSKAYSGIALANLWHSVVISLACFTVPYCLADSCLRFPVRAPLHRISCFFCTCKAFVSNFGNLILREMFDTNQCVLCTAHSNEFIKLCLNSCGITILGVLNNEHHQKRDDRRSCIDNQLPAVGVMEYGTRDCPHNDNECCQQKRNRSP